jgi:hypothetical protein
MVSINNNELAKRLKRIQTDIKELKFRQAVGGDSWVVYRTELDFLHQAGGSTGHYYQIDFQPDVGGKFVAKAYWTTPDRLTGGTELAPDPNVNGRFYMVDSIFGSPTTRTIFVYSTKRGKIVITDISLSHSA